VLFGLSLVAWLALIAFPDDLAPLAYENGLIEWVGTLLFAAAAAVFWVAAARERRLANRIVAAFLGLIFFVSFMEELSWGQQVFKWSTPPAFESNRQNETNLHNFAIGFDQQQVFTLGILGLTIGLPILYLWAPTRRLIRRLGLPVVSLGVAAWVFATFAIANVSERMMGSETHRGLREFNETMWAVAALLVGVATLQAAQRSTAPTDPSAPHRVD
jgi:glucan phosphoethanolaminetransferase (alkaline phosphatase superfamily)